MTSDVADYIACDISADILARKADGSNDRKAAEDFSYYALCSGPRYQILSHVFAIAQLRGETNQEY